MRIAQKISVMMAFLALGCPVGPVANCSYAAEVKDIVAEAQKIRNEHKDFKVKLWTQGGKTSYTVDELVTFMFEADRDCYVTLIDIGTSGKVYRLFPNEFQESNKVEKGKTYTIPQEQSNFALRIQGPEGVEFVKAIATLEPLKSIEKAEFQGKGNFLEMVDPALTIKDIGLELAQQEGKNWAEAEVSFKIVPKDKASQEQTRPSSLKLSTEKPVYKVGEPITFSVQSEQEGNLTLIDIGSSGKVHIIFPNKYNTDNRIKAGIAYRIPTPEKVTPITYKVVSPPGPNTIKAICTLRPVKMFSRDLKFDDQVFPAVGSKDEILKEIKDVLETAGTGSFTEAEVTIQITQ